MKTVKVIFSWLFLFSSLSISDVISQQYQVSQNTYNSSANSINLNSKVKFDKMGNYYVMCISEDPGSGMDFTILKYSSAGPLLWDYKFNGAMNGRDEPLDFCLDNEGSVYVTGKSQTSSFINSCATIKLSSSGLMMWNKVLDNTSHIQSEGNSIALDEAGNIHVAGSAGNPKEILLIKYNTHGEILHQVRYNQRKSSNSIAYDIKIKNNKIIVCGESTQPDQDYDLMISCFDLDGKFNWMRLHNGNANTRDMASSVHIDNNNNIYSTGFLESNLGKQDIVTLKYDMNGNLIWKTEFNGTANGYDWPNHVLTDSKGNAYVCGGSQNTRVDDSECYSDLGKCQNDATVIKYRPDGVIDWVRIYNGTENMYDCLQGMVIDRNDNIYASGRSHNNLTNGDDDMIFFKYNTSGDLLSFNRFNSGSSNAEYGNDIDVDLNGNVVAVGSIWQNNLYNLLAVKHKPTTIISNDNNSSGTFKAKAYPNPFNPSTVITFNVPAGADNTGLPVNIVVFNSLGKEVAQLTNEIMNPGIHEIRFDGSNLTNGVYFYRITSGNNIEINKLMLIK